MREAMRLVIYVQFRKYDLAGHIAERRAISISAVQWAPRTDTEAGAKGMAAYISTGHKIALAALSYGGKWLGLAMLLMLLEAGIAILLLRPRSRLRAGLSLVRLVSVRWGHGRFPHAAPAEVPGRRAPVSQDR